MNASMEDVIRQFNTLYGQPAFMVRAPGRINLIGEHVDYNDGFVMPASINFATYFCMMEANDGQSEIYSLHYQERYVADMEDPRPVATPAWANYLLGVIQQFNIRNIQSKPFKCVFGGDVPMGAGLSSSASVECGFAFGLNQLNEANISRAELIRIAQWAEHHYAGVKCGIMDQFASMMGAKDRVMLLDCRSLAFEYLPMNLGEYVIVLCDTKVKHSLASSAYNTRRLECESGLQLLQKHFHVQSFRDVTEKMVFDLRDVMPVNIFSRVSYVVSEIGRVQRAAHDLKANDIEAFGKKMFETHEGLSRLYEVSCKELDFLVDTARRFEGVIGARMMGGGFGGCTINLVKKQAIDVFLSNMEKQYTTAFGQAMASYCVRIEDGTQLLKTPVTIAS